jgi:hypothetical protein
MPLKDQFGKKCTITIELFKGLKKWILQAILSTPRRGESIFEYKYLREFEAKSDRLET